jgi:hypothetical protein
MPDEPYPSSSFDFNSSSTFSNNDFHNMAAGAYANSSFTHPSHARADETLSGVLLGVFCDFMEGDFQMLRTFLSECSLFLLGLLGSHKVSGFVDLLVFSFSFVWDYELSLAPITAWALL